MYIYVCVYIDMYICIFIYVYAPLPQVSGAAHTYSIGVPSALHGLLTVLSWLELDF